MKKGYLVVQGVVTDPEGFKAYNAELPPIYAKYGGRYLSVSPPPRIEVVEGAAENRAILIVEFPSKDTALGFWNSPEYTAAKKLREGKGTFFVAVLEGLPEAAA